MCELFTVATATGMKAITVMDVVGVAAAGLSAMSSYQDSQARKAQADHQAQMSRNNQIIANRNAEEILKQGKEEANRYRGHVDQLKANQMVSLVAQGTDVTEGTSIDLLADTAEQGERDARTIESNADREAYNARVQGMNYGSQANLYEVQAASYNPLMAGVSSLLSGAGTVADKWNRKPTKPKQG